LRYQTTSDGAADATLRGVLHFTPDMLWLRKVIFTDDWQEVGDTRVLSSHNRDGRFRFIANRKERAHASSTHVGTAEFIAVHAGTTTVYFDEDDISESDSASRNISIIPREEELPTQLFDIRASMDTNIVRPGVVPRFRLSFTSFGSIPTPLDFQINVFDEDGNVVHYWKDAVVVETEHEYTYDIPLEKYEPGYYMVVAKTKYRSDVTDFFRTSFTIPVEASPRYVYGGVAFTMLIGIGLIMLGVLYRRGKVPRIFRWS